MNTRDIMDLALALSKTPKMPADCAIHVPSDSVQRVLLGIDADVGTLLAAKSLGFDLLITHHPLGGRAVVDFPKLLKKHAGILRRHGVPKKAADAAVRALTTEHAPKAQAANYDHLPSLARLLHFPLMNVHSPCDDIGRRIVEDTLKRNVTRRAKVSDAVRALERLPEFAKAETRIAVRMGRPANPVGKWMVVLGAGTNGGYPVASAAYRHGIDTVVYMHIDPGHLKRLHDEFGARGGKNLIALGHMAGDSVGINVFVRELRKRGLDVTCFSGIIEA